MSGIGPYWEIKKLDLVLIEGNKYCYEILKEFQKMKLF